MRPEPVPREGAADPVHAFGYGTLGPILAEFAQRLWLFQRLVPRPEEATLLFCARGGLRLQAIYERFLLRTGLAPTIPFDSLMVSRLIAARMAATNPTDALLDELGREFRDRPMAEVAACLAQRDDLDLPPLWYDVYRPETFRVLAAGARDLRAAIAMQNDLFRAHLDARTAGRSTVILCDTGLYGSTVRLLREAMPERRWLSVQFARSNYKGFAAPHFDVTVGLSVERDLYAPWDLRSCVLRFWHLVESVLEPELPSARAFAVPPGGTEPLANTEVPGWRERVLPAGPCLFSGALAYVDHLTPESLRGLDDEAVRGWRRLRRTLIRPRPSDLPLLTLGDRSRDFGRREQVAQFAERRGAPARIRASLWREGALIREHPRLGAATLPMLEALHVLRAIRDGLGGPDRRGRATA